MPASEPRRLFLGRFMAARLNIMSIESCVKGSLLTISAAFGRPSLPLLIKGPSSSDSTFAAFSSFSLSAGSGFPMGRGARTGVAEAARGEEMAREAAPSSAARLSIIESALTEHLPEDDAGGAGRRAAWGWREKLDVLWMHALRSTRAPIQAPAAGIFALGFFSLECVCVRVPGLLVSARLRPFTPPVGLKLEKSCASGLTPLPRPSAVAWRRSLF
mmetsp:Transcript_46271/g.112655  ORF Transcript_46271/g.112655 Transcript_46271/m.112655 type:complete len:216 (-) Transcript_46271:42-689(-)